MTEVMPLILFVMLFILLLMGYPVAFTLGGVAILLGIATFGTNFFNLLPLRIWGVMTNYVLMAVPLFVYMGVMLEKSGLAEDSARGFMAGKGTEKVERSETGGDAGFGSI